MEDVTPESAPALDASSAAPTVEPAFAPPIAAPGSGSVEPWSAPNPGDAFPAAFPPATELVPQPPPRRPRGPLIGLIAGVAAVALGVGGYAIASSQSASKDNTPVATSSRLKSGDFTVTGHGISMLFPPGWVNVPTSPSQFRQYLKSLKGHIPEALQAGASDPQLVSSLAMLVYRPSAQGTFEENMNAFVLPPGPPPSQLVALLKSGQIQGPAQVGATDVQYSTTYFATYPGVLITYTLSIQGITVYGAVSYLEGPASTVVTTVTSLSAETSQSDLLGFVDTLSFT